MENLLGNFTRWMTQESDERARDWLLMSSPLPTIAICAFYLVASKLLHSWMKKREPIDIRWLIWGFDFFHLVVSSSLICFLIALKVFDDVNFR
jgi:membrane-anchored protein YejM (alkaline phosphatase superfamily)